MTTAQIITTAVFVAIVAGGLLAVWNNLRRPISAMKMIELRQEEQRIESLKWQHRQHLRALETRNLAARRNDYQREIDRATRALEWCGRRLVAVRAEIARRRA